MAQKNVNSIRPMTLSDIEAVRGYYDTLDRYHRDHLPWLFHRPDMDVRNRKFFANIIDDDQSTILVAETSRVVGFVQIRIVSAPDFPIFVPQNRSLIDAIFVDSVNRRKGVGSHLMRAAEEWSAGRGATGIDLGVYQFNNTAQKLFSSTGYTTLSKRMTKQLL